MQACINGATTRPYALEEDLVAAGAAGFPLVEIWAGKLQPTGSSTPSPSSASPWRRQALPWQPSAPTGCNALVTGAKGWRQWSAPPALGLMLDTFHYYKSGVAEEGIAAVPTERWVILHVTLR